MTEDEAKKKNCIFLVCAMMVVKSQTKVSIEGIDKLIKCIASDCMLWMWTEDYHKDGYCGLASK